MREDVGKEETTMMKWTHGGCLEEPDVGVKNRLEHSMKNSVKTTC